MVVAVGSSILADRRIYQGLMELKRMGLVVHAEEIRPGHALILIDVESILGYIVKKVGKTIQYPYKDVSLDMGNGVIRVEVWKGGAEE